MKDSKRKRNIVIAVILIFLFVYVVIEAIYRINKYNTLLKAYKPAGYTVTDTRFYQLDKQTGYSYIPNEKTILKFFDLDGNLRGQNNLRANNLGHTSPRDDLIKMNDSEFRITCLGDSFTAITPTEVPWPTVLEDLLNADDEMKRLTGKTTFKVLNLGLDGTGLSQWPSVYDYKAKKFDPHLVIVNFMWNDIYRKFLYRDTIKWKSDISDYSVLVTSTSLPTNFKNSDCRFATRIVVNSSIADDKEKMLDIRKDIYRKRVQALPWFQPYPELIARLFGLPSRLELTKGATPMYDDEEVALTSSLEALNYIKSEHGNVLMFFHPTLGECKSKQAASIVTEFIKRGRDHDLKIHNMLESLPVDTTEDELEKWYNLPHDWHPSNYGCRVYAPAVLKKIKEHMLGQKVNSSQ